MSGAALDIRHTMHDLAARYRATGRERVAAAARALNRVMTTVRKEAARELAKEYVGIKVSSLKARLKLKRAKASDLSAAVIFSGKRIALYGNFGMRTKGRFGVSFRRLPWRIETITGDPVTPEMLARAFRQRSTRSGRADAFARQSKARLSFEILLAPGVARALTERKIGTALRRLAVQRFAIVYEQETRFRVGKRST